MREQILEQIHDHGPKTVCQIADSAQLDVYELSIVAVAMIDEGLIYLEPADGTLWYAEVVGG